MSFIGDIGDKITQLSRDATEKAKDLAENTRLTSLLRDKSGQTDKICAQLGKSYYELHKDDPESELEEQVSALRQLYEELDEIKTQLLQLKGYTACPFCSAEFPASQEFCPACGKKIPAFSSDGKYETVKDGAAGKIICPTCGYPMKKGSNFCIICGSPMKKDNSDSARANERQKTSVSKSEAQSAADTHSTTAPISQPESTNVQGVSDSHDKPADTAFPVSSSGIAKDEEIIYSSHSNGENSPSAFFEEDDNAEEAALAKKISAAIREKEAAAAKDIMHTNNLNSKESSEEGAFTAQKHTSTAKESGSRQDHGTVSARETEILSDVPFTPQNFSDITKKSAADDENDLPDFDAIDERLIVEEQTISDSGFECPKTEKTPSKTESNIYDDVSVCAECGAGEPRGSVFCSKCGAPYSKTSAADILRPELNSKQCRVCSAVLPADAVFCTKCGTPCKKDSSPPVCPCCGAFIQANTAFCAECGAKLC